MPTQVARRKKRAEIAEAVKASPEMTMDEACTKFNCAASTVYHACREHGVTNYPQSGVNRGMSAEKAVTIVALTVQGHTQQEIATEVGVSKTYIQRILAWSRDAGFDAQKALPARIT